MQTRQRNQSILLAAPKKSKNTIAKIFRYSGWNSGPEKPCIGSGPFIFWHRPNYSWSSLLKALKCCSILAPEEAIVGCLFQHFESSAFKNPNLVKQVVLQQHVSFNDKSPKADNLRRGWMRGFQAFLWEQQLVVVLESVGSKTMNRKMKSTLQGEFDGIPSRRDQPNKWAQRIQLPQAIQPENHSCEDPRK